MEINNYFEIQKLERDNWWYKARRDLFDQLLHSFKSEFAAALDAGCGVGSNHEVLAKYAKSVQGLDVSDVAINFCKDKGYVNLDKASLIDFQSDAQFDLILCADVLEHLDDNLALQNLTRHLAPGGVIILSVPAHKCLWNINDDFSQHLRRYEPRELENVINRQGLQIIKLGYWNCCAFLPVLIYSRWYQHQKRNRKIPLKSSLNLIPGFLNGILYLLLCIENFFFMRLGLVNGVSIVCVCRK